MSTGSVMFVVSNKLDTANLRGIQDYLCSRNQHPKLILESELASELDRLPISDLQIILTDWQGSEWQLGSLCRRYPHVSWVLWFTKSLAGYKSDSRFMHKVVRFAQR